MNKPNLDLFDQWANETHLNDEGHWDEIKAYIAALEQGIGRVHLLRRANTRLRAAIREIADNLAPRFFKGRHVPLSADVQRKIADRLRALIPERKCECNLRTKLVGDGCDICNPSYAERQWEDEGGAI